MKNKLSLIAIALSLTINAAVSAKTIDSQPLAAEQLSGTHVSFREKTNTINTTLNITGPGDFHASKSARTGIPSIDLYQHGELKDGLYNYEITSAIGKRVMIKDKMNNGRGENDSHMARKRVTQSGHFRVLGGQIKQFKPIKEAAVVTR